MPKPLLTPENVQEFTDDLYVKTDAEIVSEANAVALDFATWLDNNFDLTTEQSTYIATFPARVNKFYGHLFASGFLSESPISFAAAPPNPAPRRTKETRANLFGEVKYNDTDQELTGTFDIKVSFALL
ncbi:MAG: hypothetical protein BGO31_11025 [Bacteroidetes bacterium 43-16]|uniref:hypothetical protein n=1 Tax=uncultured Dysgonomonas sp. TaxID=206096 RepID=UPI00092BCEDA|nr:hypothetical protein [uncultured Dysgonomonas sp.]OJV50992.1 MAG: hypothetical protein BGO31_11025 [Bacteroidetes bacterium 43-16]